MSKGVHVAHNKLEASPQDQRGQGGHGAIPLSAGMLLVTLGVVYGDIGTSPMYTMKSIVANNGGIGTVSEDMISGRAFARHLDHDARDHGQVRGNRHEGR